MKVKSFTKVFGICCLSIMVIGFFQEGLAKEVILYSSNQPELIEMVSRGFEAKTGIKVSPVRLGTGEAMKRIQAEKDNPLCDVFWSGDVAVLDNAKKNFMTYKSPEAKVLPANYVEKDQLWTSTNVHIMIIMVNKKLVSESEKPNTWADLFLPKWKGKVAMANPEKSGSAYAQVYGIYKLYGWEGLKKLIANAKILDSSSLIYKGTAEGEYSLGITMEYAAYRYIVGGSKDVGILYPQDGAFDAPEGAAIINHCKHPEEAKSFFDYLLSKEVEKEIFEKHYRRPARPDIVISGGLPKISEIKLLKGFDPIEANILEKEILKQWKEIILSR
jgi:iron(III) transport system substrate-binding protein